MPKIRRTSIKNTVQNISSFEKIAISVILLLLIIGGSNFITSSFPQQILVSKDTIIEFNNNILSFQDIGETGANITINGKQEQANNYDVIAMGGRESVILTGKQSVLDEQTFFNGLLTVPTKFNHVALFEQSTLSIDDSVKSFEIEFLDVNIKVLFIGNDIYKITSGENNYNILLPNDKITYITDFKNRGLYKLWHKDNKIFITLVGFYGKEELKIKITEEKLLEI